MKKYAKVFNKILANPNLCAHKQYITTKFGFILKMQEWFIICNSIHINIYHHSVLKDKSYHHLIRHRRSLGQNPISLPHKNREEDKDGGNLPQSNDSIYDSIYKIL